MDVGLLPVGWGWVVHSSTAYYIISVLVKVKFQASIVKFLLCIFDRPENATWMNISGLHG